MTPFKLKDIFEKLLPGIFLSVFTFYCYSANDDFSAGAYKHFEDYINIKPTARIRGFMEEHYSAELKVNNSLTMQGNILKRISQQERILYSLRKT